MSWKPIKDKHSIERVQFILGFQEPLTQKTFDELGASFEKNHSEDYGFNKRTESRPAYIEPTMSQNTLENLTIARDEVSFEVANYDRWDSFYKTAKKIIKQTTDITSKTVNISRLSLDYWDKFVFNGNTPNTNPALLLKNLEQHLPETVFTDGELWHLTKGWLQATGNEKDKILINLNCSAQDAEHSQTKEIHRLVEIHTLTAFRKIYSEKSIDSLIKDMQILHKVSKDVFSDSLVDDMKKSVGL